jgi:hypothetical protein
MLRELMKNLVGFVPFESPISLEIVFEYPLVGDNIGVAWCGTKSKCSWT